MYAQDDIGQLSSSASSALSSANAMRGVSALSQVVHRLVIEPLKSAEHSLLQQQPSTSGNATDSEAEGSDWWGSRKLPPAERARLRAIEQQKQQRDAQQLRSANASRLPSAFFSKRGERDASLPPGGGSLLPPHSEAGERDSDDDDGHSDRGGSNGQSSALAGRRRKSGEMGARKLAKTPKGKEGSKDSAADGRSKSRSRSSSNRPGGGDRSSKGETTKAEVGSSIDLRKLAKAKKVQVFKGHGAAVMVVGQKRLVVIEHRPTKLEPHQGVVLWISSLENVAKVEMEIKPGSTLNATDVAVSLKVDVKEGEAYVFKLGYKEAGVVVASIYARLHGEEPPPISAQKQQRTGSKSTSGGGGAAAEGTSASSAHRSTSAEDPKTPPGSKSIGGSGGGDSKSGWSSRHKSGGGARRSERQSSHRKKRSHRKGPRLDAENGSSSKHCSGSSSSSAAANATSGVAPASPLGASVSPTVLRGCGAGLNSSPESGAPDHSSPHPASPSTGGFRSHGSSSSGGGFGLKLEAALESSSGVAPASSPDAKTKGHLSSPLRIVLSPSGKGRNLQLQVSSITTDGGNVCLQGINAGLSEHASGPMPSLPAKFVGMLSVGVPPDAVAQKLLSELPHLTEEQVRQMLLNPATASSTKSEAKSASTEAEATAELSAEEEASVKKYRGMIKAGVPPQAVDNKMTQDGLARKLIDSVLGIKSAPEVEKKVEVAKATEELSEEEETSVKKYRGMIKAGVPAQAVRNKMTSESLASRLIDAVCGSLEGAAGDNSENATAALSEDEEKACSKFRSMLKAGVPAQAVRNKMAAENLAAKLINSVCGAEHVETGGTESWAGRSDKGGKGSSNGTGKGTGGKGGGEKQSKMLTLHWTPLDFSEEDHKNSVWARGAGSRRASTGGLGGSSSGGGCDSPELKRLELLFSKKPAAASKAAADDDGDGSGENAQKKKKKQRPKPLERARMQNLAIGLRSFKDMRPASVGEALSTLDAPLFSAEQCARLVEMLPMDAEVSAVKKLKQDLLKDAQEASDSSSTPAVVSLEPAEEFVLGFSGVLRPKPKLAVLNLMVTLEPTAREHAANLATVRRALAQVVASDRLASILGEVLRVGNAMNAGTAKGGAQGVTVESLLKLTQTRSVGTGRDSLTVLDYIAETLLKKQSEGDEVRRAAMLDALLSPAAQDGDCDDDEGGDGDCDASTDATRDITRRCDATQTPGVRGAAVANENEGEEEESGDGLVEAAPLDFWRELPDLEAASRLPIADLSAQVVSLRAALGTARREFAKLEDEAKQEAEAQSQTPSAQGGETATAATGPMPPRKVGKLKLPQAADSSSSSAASDPRAGLMAMLKARGAAADQESVPSAAPATVPKEAGEAAAAATREVPAERASADDDEATAVVATKAAADAAGLRTTSFLAADPRAGLMAALKARRAQDDDEEEGTAKAPSSEPESMVAAAAPSASDKASSAQPVEPAGKVCAAGAAAKALGEFLNGAEALVASLEKEAASTKADADGMALFFGERGQDPGHIFDCLRKFSAMTREAKCKAEAKAAEQQRKQRIADAEVKAAASGGAKTLRKKPAPQASEQADIDPKAGLMSEIRRRSEIP